VTEPKTKEASTSAELKHGFQVLARVQRGGQGDFVRIDARGRPDSVGVIGVYVPPWSWRVGNAVRRFLERLEAFGNWLVRKVKRNG
jgi:hypothetical protein